jgi:hypothetical protein
MPIRTVAAFLLLLTTTLYAQDDLQTGAIAEINRAFRNHRFDPSIMAPFDRRQVDPVIVEMEWNGVRGHVEHALKRLNAGIRPISLPCVFRPVPAADDQNGKAPPHLIPVFIFEKRNSKAKRVLKQVLGLRDDALWDYEPATGQVFIPDSTTETVAATTGDFKPEYRKGGSLNLVDVYKGLQAILDDKSLKEYHFQPIPARIHPKGLRFATVWITCCKTRFTAYAWRLKVTLERSQPDTWELISKVEIGKRYASQAEFSVVADSMKGDFLAEHVTVGKSSTVHGKGKTHMVMKPVLIPGEPVKAEVPPPIERVMAKEVSPLEEMVPLFADLCRNKLLSSVEVKP